MHGKESTTYNYITYCLLHTKHWPWGITSISDCWKRMTIQYQLLSFSSDGANAASSPSQHHLWWIVPIAIWLCYLWLGIWMCYLWIGTFFQLQYNCLWFELVCDCSDEKYIQHCVSQKQHDFLELYLLYLWTLKAFVVITTCLLYVPLLSHVCFVTTTVMLPVVLATRVLCSIKVPLQEVLTTVHDDGQLMQSINQSMLLWNCATYIDNKCIILKPAYWAHWTMQPPVRTNMATLASHLSIWYAALASPQSSDTLAGALQSKAATCLLPQT